MTRLVPLCLLIGVALLFGSACDGRGGADLANQRSSSLSPVAEAAQPVQKTGPSETQSPKKATGTSSEVLRAPAEACAPGSVCLGNGNPAPAAAQTAPASRVVQVVFVEKENCCECTRTRQENSWRILQDAIGASGVPVDVVKVFIDTQRDAAQVYLDMRPIMATPGLYFLDKSGFLVELLQGEVSQAQVADLLALKP